MIINILLYRYECVKFYNFRILFPNEISILSKLYENAGKAILKILPKVIYSVEGRVARPPKRKMKEYCFTNPRLIMRKKKT